MKIKIRKNRLSGEVNAEYFKVPDKASFRYNFIKNILSEQSGVFIFIDTNQRKEDIPDTDLDGYLKQSGVSYSISPTEANRTTFFGVSLNYSNKKREEKLIILEIAHEQFTPELFKACIENFDIGIGIGRKEANSDILRQQRLNFDNILFSDSYFEKSIYDSVLCSSMRSTFDIEKYILD